MACLSLASDLAKPSLRDLDGDRMRGADHAVEVIRVPTLSPLGLLARVIALCLDVTRGAERDAVLGDVTSARHFVAVGDVMGVQITCGAAHATGVVVPGKDCFAEVVSDLLLALHGILAPGRFTFTRKAQRVIDAQLFRQKMRKRERSSPKSVRVGS